MRANFKFPVTLFLIRWFFVFSLPWFLQFSHNEFNRLDYVFLFEDLVFDTLWDICYYWMLEIHESPYTQFWFLYDTLYTGGIYFLHLSVFENLGLKFLYVCRRRGWNGLSNNKKPKNAIGPRVITLLYLNTGCYFYSWISLVISIASI